MLPSAFTAPLPIARSAVPQASANSESMLAKAVRRRDRLGPGLLPRKRDFPLVGRPLDGEARGVALPHLAHLALVALGLGGRGPVVFLLQLLEEIPERWLWVGRRVAGHERDESAPGRHAPLDELQCRRCGQQESGDQEAEVKRGRGREGQAKGRIHAEQDRARGPQRVAEAPDPRTGA